LSIRQSLLAILNQGPCYGYQLRSEFNRRTGDTWQLNVGQIYNTLDRLERDGLVEKAGTNKAGTNKEGHTYYAITDAGARDVCGWLGSPVARSAAVRDELSMKLAIAVTLPATDVAEIIQVQRASSKQVLKELLAARNAFEDALSTAQIATLLIMNAQVLAIEAQLRWLDQTESQLAQASAAGGAQPLPLNRDVPKRGRPVRRASPVVE
jgi:DNA-binding PadR family transcriptional regulator